MQVRAHTPQMELFQPIPLGEHQRQQSQQHRPQQLQMRKQPLLQNVNVELEPGLTIEQLNEHLMVANIKGKML